MQRKYFYFLPAILFTLILPATGTARTVKSRPWRVKSVIVNGNGSFARFELLNRMELRPVFLKKAPHFSKSRLEADRKSIIRFYRDRGFLSVIVNAEVTGRDTARKRVFIRIAISEGRRTVITQVNYLPEKPDSTVFPSLQCTAEKPFEISSVENDERVLREQRTRRGYLFAAVTARMIIDTAAAKANITFITADGPRVVVDTVTIEGAPHLKKRVVSRELTFNTGDTLSSDDATTSEQRLYQTGLFSSVYIEPVADSLGDSTGVPNSVTLPVAVTLREADFFRLKFGAGYGTDEGIRGSSETSYHNLFSLGHRVTLKGDVSPLKQDGTTVYTTPWLFGIPLRFDASVYFNRFSDSTTYQGNFWGSLLSVERMFGDYINCQWWTKYENVLWLDTANLPGEFPLKNTQSFGFDLTFDSRDNLLDPVTGAYSLLKCEAAGIAGINSNQFMKVTADNRFYWKVRKLNCASGIRIGWVRPYGKSTIVPIQDQFFAGGSRSVRGFKKDLLLTYIDSSDTSVHAKSGTFLATANLLEIRFPIIWWIHGAFFADAGILRDAGSDLRLKSVVRNMRWTAGPGLRINTPIAILRFDIGFKLHRKPGESLTQWYFDVGQSF